MSCFDTVNAKNLSYAEEKPVAFQGKLLRFDTAAEVVRHGRDDLSPAPLPLCIVALLGTIARFITTVRRVEHTASSS